MRVLLEREREIAEMDAVLEKAVSGKGCAVAIEAAAGLGKTRLLQEARAAGTQAGLGVLAARATELEQSFPFALVRQLFESPLATLPEAERTQVLEGATAARGALGLDSEMSSDSFAVLHGLYWVTAALAERKPLLLAIDDAHWADAASLDYLGFLLPRLEELPVLLILTCRPEEPDPSGGLGRVLTDPVVRHLKPGPLSAEAMIALLTEQLDRQPEPPFAAACHEVSGGNPFLLSELARMILEQKVEPVAGEAEWVRGLAPERVARVVLIRLGRLSPEAGDYARALAVLGDGSDTGLVAELAGLEPEAASSAADELRTGTIFDPGAEPRFIHPLVRNAIYVDIPAGERALAHTRAAALLRDHAADPERIATQLLATEARGDGATVETLLAAGERALASGAARSAIAYLDRARREPPPADLRAAVLEPLIIATYRAADQAVFAAIEADVFAEMERDQSLRSRWAVHLSMVMGMGGRFEEVGAMLREAVDVAAAEGDVQRAFQLETQLKTVALLGASVGEVDLERYADQIDPDSPAGRLAAAMEARAANTNGTAEEAADAAKRALAKDAVIFDEELEIAAAVISVLTLVISDELDAARHAVERALVRARANGGTTTLVRALFLSAFVAWGYGDLSTAEADLRQAMELARLAEIAPLVLLFTPALVEILIERDELEAAEAELQGIGMAAGPVPESVLFNTVLVYRLHLRVEQGAFEQAAEDFDLFAGQMEAMGMGSGIVMGCTWGARALVAVGEQARARELTDKMVDVARRWGSPSTIALVLRAVATSRAGAEGLAALEEAAALMEGSPRRLAHAHVLTDLGAALRREGRRAEAREPLRQAFELARRCGAARLAKRAHAELQATGETVRRYAPIGVESLTPSERRVAELAASGMTNRQIAQSLFVTVKTVEAHLSAAYDKLDIDSRQQLGDALGAPDRNAE